MKYLLVLIALIGAVGCVKTASSENTQETVYGYGDLLKIKKGFYKNYSCVLLQEYENSVFCRIWLTPDKEKVLEYFQTNQNFEKSNVEPFLQN